MAARTAKIALPFVTLPWAQRLCRASSTHSKDSVSGSVLGEGKRTHLSLTCRSCGRREGEGTLAATLGYLLQFEFQLFKIQKLYKLKLFLFKIVQI
jgi:hypothetical protein